MTNKQYTLSSPDANGLPCPDASLALLIAVESERTEPVVLVVRRTGTDPAAGRGLESDSVSHDSVPDGAVDTTRPVEPRGWESCLPQLVDALSSVPRLTLERDDGWSRLVIVRPDTSADVPEEVTFEVERSGWLVRLSSTNEAHPAREFVLPEALRDIRADVLLLELLSHVLLWRRWYTDDELKRLKEPRRARGRQRTTTRVHD